MPRTALLLALLAAPAVQAQDLVTDRPDFTESPVAVPLGSVQIEAGGTLTLEGDATEYAGPETLVRWSFLPGAEVRVGLPDYRAVRAGGATVDGVTDGALGVKVELATLAGWDLGFIGEASVPLGDDAVGSTVVSPLAILIAGRDLGAVSLGTQAEARWNRETDTAEFAATAVVGTEIVPGLGTFGELFGELVEDRLGLLGHAGLTYRVAPFVQLDVHAGVGLTEAAPDALLGVGASARF